MNIIIIDDGAADDSDADVRDDGEDSDGDGGIDGECVSSTLASCGTYRAGAKCE